MHAILWFIFCSCWTVLAIKQIEIQPIDGLSFLRDFWAWCGFWHITLKFCYSEQDMKRKILLFSCSYSEASCHVPVVSKRAACYWNIFVGQKLACVVRAIIISVLVLKQKHCAELKLWSYQIQCVVFTEQLKLLALLINKYDQVLD